VNFDGRVLNVSSPADLILTNGLVDRRGQEAIGRSAYKHSIGLVQQQPSVFIQVLRILALACSPPQPVCHRCRGARPPALTSP